LSKTLDKNRKVWYNIDMKNKYSLPFLLFMNINDEENQNSGGCGGCFTIVIVVAVLLLAMSICSSIVH